MRDWHGGANLHESAVRLLALAWEERTTLITYDVNTFPLAVKERIEGVLSPAGMIYVSSRYHENDCGGIAETDWRHAPPRPSIVLADPMLNQRRILLSIMNPFGVASLLVWR